ncbi:MAG: lycopene cyclase domain-containing protein [Anaerolineales bacterium]|nr:lycopene cyclase domain-containing protein [Anaerolineales bacterium]
MTYLNFLLYFVVLPAAVLTLIVRPTRREWLVLGVLLVITYAWTTPWDNFLVGSGVWYYDPQLVTGLVLGWVPVEEYLFFGLQVWLSGMWTLGLIRFFAAESTAWPQAALLPAAALAGLSFRPVAETLGLGGPARDLPALPFGHWNYLILILGWAVPVLLGQLWLGWGAFRARWQIWLAGALVPALYLTAVDSIAIGAGTWTIAPAQSLNVFLPAGVPVEEGVFFLATNLLLVQGLLLFTSPEVEARLRGWLRR